MNTRTRTQAPVAQEHKADIDTSDMDLGSMDKSLTLDADLSIEELRDHLNAGTGQISSFDLANWSESIAYMEEKVLVRVLPSAEPGAEKIIEVFNNGIPQRFIRDEWVVARRKFVEVLARALPFSVTTPEALDGRGDKTRRIDVHNGQRFPFEMKDPSNPAKGAAWLQSLMAGR